MKTLKRSGEFERVRRQGRSWALGPVVLNAAGNGGDYVRCGFVAGKKVGGAVERNRARRLMREAVRQRLHLIKPGWDLVWIARHSILDAKLDAVGKSVNEALLRSRLITEAQPATDEAQSRIIEHDGDKKTL